jgi:hypothetical protein
MKRKDQVMATTDIPIARTIKMQESLIIGIRTFVRVPECNIDGEHYSRMAVKDNVIWLDCPCCKGQGIHPLDQEYAGQAYGCDECEGKDRFKKFLEPIRVYREP